MTITKLVDDDFRSASNPASLERERDRRPGVMVEKQERHALRQHPLQRLPIDGDDVIVRCDARCSRRPTWLDGIDDYR